MNFLSIVYYQSNVSYRFVRASDTTVYADEELEYIEVPDEWTNDEIHRQAHALTEKWEALLEAADQWCNDSVLGGTY